MAKGELMASESQMGAASSPSQQVVTVLGPVAPDDLGIALGHDHLLVDSWDFTDRFSSYSGILDDEELAIQEVDRFRKAGGGAIFDPTNMGLGRQPEAMCRISEATGVHVVMGTGWYRERAYEQYVFEEQPTRLAERLLRDLMIGVGDTGICAGFIGEIGTERRYISPAEERVFRAAARAQVQSGCTIMTHTTNWGELAMEQLALLREEGVDAARVVVSHVGDRTGVARLRPIAEAGAWLGIDNLGSTRGHLPLEVRAELVAELWAEGFGDRILLGNDIGERDQLATYGGCGYDNVIVNFFPLLRAQGMTDDQVHAMSVENPSRAFAYDFERARRLLSGPSPR